MAVGDFHCSVYHAVALALAIHFYMGDIVNVLRELCHAESCDYVLYGAHQMSVCPPLPSIGSAQGTSETSGNKCAAIQKVNSCF